MLVVVVTLAFTAAYTPSTSRRQAIQTFVAGTLVGSVSPNLVFALDPCNPNSQNCVFTTWTPPSGTSKLNSIKDLRLVIGAYPQQGQAEVDGGGWTIISDQLDEAGIAKVEYRSSGKGFFAKAFNGGKPFVDDLIIEVDGSGEVQVRSQSRVGESDLGVNAKRVSYLAAELKEKGWTI